MRWIAERAGFPLLISVSVTLICLLYWYGYGLNMILFMILAFVPVTIFFKVFAPALSRQYAILGFFMLATIIAGWHLQTASINQTIKTGDQIVLSLEKYKSAHGHYPDRLELLKADFNGRSMRPTVADEFCYELVRPDKFYLHFITRSYELWGYAVEAHMWVHD